MKKNFLVIAECVYLQKTIPSTNNKSAFSENTDAVIEVAELSKKDISDINRDPSILAFTPNLPTELIVPVSSIDATTSAEDLDLSDIDETNNSLHDTYEYTWGIQAVGAHKSNYTGKGAIIAILDTGIDASHERFSGVDISFQNFTV